jgi:dTDP-4-dehydrorhamnose 3,5-epimerase
MKRIDTSLPGVFILEPTLITDQRGWFMESYNRKVMEENGILDVFVQDNQSSSLQNTLRGLHYQLRFPQAKLCRVLEGEVLDTVVDIRRGSPSYGHWVTVQLTAENRRQLYVPRGYAHGFAVISEHAEFFYKCSDFYHPDDEKGIRWDDPDLKVYWQLSTAPIISQKDASLPCLRDIPAADLPALESAS